MVHFCVSDLSGLETPVACLCSALLQHSLDCLSDPKQERHQETTYVQNTSEYSRHDIPPVLLQSSLRIKTCSSVASKCCIRPESAEASPSQLLGHQMSCDSRPESIQSVLQTHAKMAKTIFECKGHPKGLEKSILSSCNTSIVYTWCRHPNKHMQQESTGLKGFLLERCPLQLLTFRRVARTGLGDWLLRPPRGLPQGNQQNHTKSTTRYNVQVQYIMNIMTNFW